MATLPSLQDEPEAVDSPREESAESKPSGGDPAQAIGYIDPGVSPKVKTFLLAAKAAMLNEQGARMLKGIMGKSEDPAMGIAMIVGKTIEKLQDKLGPLNDQEHDQVAFHLTGWLVSSLQHMGMPGLDAPDGRQDLMGRALQALDQATQGPAPGAAPPPQGAPVPPQGTMPQMQGGPPNG